MDLPPRDRDEVAAYAIEELGAWLRDWRIQTGRSQRTLAAWAGIDQSGISRLERGLTRVSSDRLARLVVALDWFSGGGDPSGPWSSMRLPPGAVRMRSAGGGPPRVIRSVVYRPDGDAWGVIDDEHDDGSVDAWGVIDEGDDGSGDAWGVIDDEHDDGSGDALGLIDEGDDAPVDAWGVIDEGDDAPVDAWGVIDDGDGEDAGGL